MRSPPAPLVEALRWLGRRPLLLPATALVLRARTIRPASAFLAREVLRRRVLAVYSVRESGMHIALRHRTGDVVTLGELFHEHDYEPPRELLSRLHGAKRIVDLGANIGLFGAFAAARWPGAEIVAFEPDPDNAAVHAQTIALNSLERRWHLVRAAAGVQDGQAAFLAGGAALSHLVPVDAPRSIEVAVEDVMAILADADLVKMDIEGGEWAILGDDRFRDAPPRVIVLEYHPRLCPSPDPRGLVEATLREAGLTVAPIWHRADGHGMLWAWQS